MLAPRRFCVATGRMIPDSRSRGKRKVPPAARACLRQKREVPRGRARCARPRGGLCGAAAPRRATSSASFREAGRGSSPVVSSSRRLVVLVEAPEDDRTTGRRETVPRAASRGVAGRGRGRAGFGCKRGCGFRAAARRPSTTLFRGTVRNLPRALPARGAALRRAGPSRGPRARRRGRRRGRRRRATPRGSSRRRGS